MGFPCCFHAGHPAGFRPNPTVSIDDLLHALMADGNAHACECHGYNLAGALAGGALIAFSGWLALLASAVLGLSNVVAPWLAALIVGLVVLALGAGLLLFGKSRLDLVPRRSFQSLREDTVWIREQLQ